MEFPLSAVINIGSFSLSLVCMDFTVLFSEWLS